MSRGLRAVAVFLALGTGTLPAQDPADRAALARFVDSLSGVSDPGALSALAEQYEEVGLGGGAGALAQLRAGYARLEAGQPALAERAFTRAARMAPTWPTPWLGLGSAHHALGLQTWHNPMNLGSRPGLGEFRQAADAYAMALRLDPRFVPAIERELSLAVERRDTALLNAAIVSARRLPAEARTPEFVLALSRAEWRLGNAAAAEAATRSLPKAARTPAIRYELARAALALGDSSGEAAYWEVAAADDPEMLAMLRRDLALIATDAELAAFDLAEGAERAAFLQGFWERHAARDLRPAPERLQEHYARISYADRHFAFDEVKHVRWHGDLLDLPVDSTFDSRGVVYVRQGPPDLRLRPTVIGFAPNETWAYYRGADTLVLHFAAQHTLGDFQLVESVVDVSNFMRIDPNGYEAMLWERRSVSDRYAKIPGAGRFMWARLLDEVREEGAWSIATATGTDAYPLQFPDSVQAYLLPLAIGTAAGGSRLQLAVGLVQSLDAPARELDTLRLRFGAFDDDGNVVARLDSTITYPATARGAGSDSTQLVFARFETSLPAGAWRWTAAIQAGDSIGTRYSSRTISIPIHDGTVLAVSDLAIGTEGWSAPWEVAPGDTARLTPFQALDASQPMELYYEVYGIPAAAEYRTEISARPAKGGQGQGLTLGFTELSRGTPTKVVRTINVSALRPGGYVIEVHVIADGGRTVASSRPFKIVE
ncbi:MAG TPA: GWxTD domain-containing protein [Gemmatimonadales bacterium]|nr:GWxTD domain-containing protein [Gemmatimonadales bacterium]